MMMHKVIQGQRLRGFLISLIFLLMILLLSGCGEQQSGTSLDSTETVTVSDSEKSSATLTIRWHDAPAVKVALPLQTALEYQEDDIENVLCEVYDASGNWLATGGPWSWSDHGGRVDYIPVGEDRTFVGLAEDANGNIIYQGETPGITIEPNEITQGVVIDAFPFVPTLTAPDDGDQGVTLEWQTVQNADEYIVQVAEDIDFQTIRIDESTVGTTHTPAALQPLTEYFWRIRAVDTYGNIGAPSGARSFITTSGGTTSLSGTVVDASTALPMSGVTISVDEGTYTTSTDTEGQYLFENMNPGSHQVTASISGYTSSSQSVTLEEGTPSRVDFALSETIDSGQYRIVLTWGAAPSDLDSHIWTPDGTHVYYASRGSETSEPYTELDVDDTTSYGPETITIYQVQSGTYKYSVKNYSGTPNISTSEANVKIYGESGLIQEWDVPAGDGIWWNVFTLDGDTGQISTINSISDTEQ